MVLANSFHNKKFSVQPLTEGDRAAITRLMQQALWVHVHVDWYLLHEWLGAPGFMGLKQGEELVAFLAIGADPLPASWVRGLVVGDGLDVTEVIGELLEATLPRLRQQGVNEICLMCESAWLDEFVPAFGFAPVSRVISMLHNHSTIPHFPANSAIHIRPVHDSELETLAIIEKEAFEPRWRYSAKTLAWAKRQSLSFDVAVWKGELVGYQCSTSGYQGAHLARMTVHPAQQGKGVGTTLLGHAFADYRRRKKWRVTLNTQSDNVTSQSLYGKFGFQVRGDSYPVWSYCL